VLHCTFRDALPVHSAAHRLCSDDSAWAVKILISSSWCPVRAVHTLPHMWITLSKSWKTSNERVGRGNSAQSGKSAKKKKIWMHVRFGLQDLLYFDQWWEINQTFRIICLWIQIRNERYESGYVCVILIITEEDNNHVFNSVIFLHLVFFLAFYLSLNLNYRIQTIISSEFYRGKSSSSIVKTQQQSEMILSILTQTPTSSVKWQDSSQSAAFQIIVITTIQHKNTCTTHTNHNTAKWRRTCPLSEN
jgi:hypothetical protein